MISTDGICIIIPVYNEETVIAYTLRSISSLLIRHNIQSIICVIDDGSTDKTWSVLSEEARSLQCRLICRRFSRNFGKDQAIIAGLSYVAAEAYIVLDADGQHPFELIPVLYEIWRNDKIDIIDGIKHQREVDSLVQRIASVCFNKVFSSITKLDLHSSSDFKLLSRRAVSAILRCGDYNVFFRGLSRWIGFPRRIIHFDVAERFQDKGKWSYSKRVLYALNALVMYSYAPLYFILLLGLVSLSISGALGIKLLWSYYVGQASSGYPTLLAIALMSFGAIMFTLGVIGMYVKNILDQTQNRPNFIVMDEINTIKE